MPLQKVVQPEPGTPDVPNVLPVIVASTAPLPVALRVTTYGALALSVVALFVIFTTAPSVDVTCATNAALTLVNVLPPAVNVRTPEPLLDAWMALPKVQVNDEVLTSSADAPARLFTNSRPLLPVLLTFI